MRNIRLVTLASLAFLASAALAAYAKDPGDSDAFAKRLLAVTSVEQKSFACFVRKYDAGHLKQHPKQTVTAMKLLIAVERLKDDPTLSYSYRLRVNFRSRKGEFASTGFCGHAEAADVRREGMRVACAQDCGGGGMTIAPAASDKSVIVKVDDVGIWLVDKPDDDAGLELKGGADDRVLRLDRTDIEQCRPLAEDGEELAAMQAK